MADNAAGPSATPGTGAPTDAPLLPPTPIDSTPNAGPSGPKGKGKGAPPKTAPIPRDGLKNTDAQGKFSNPTLTTNNVTILKNIMRTTVNQNIIARLYAIRRLEARALTVQPQGITVMSEVALMDETNNPVLQEVAHQFPTIINRIPVYAETEFSFFETVFDSKMDESCATTYMTAGAINMRAVTSSLRGNWQMSRAFAEGIVSELKSGLTRNDITTLFIMGHIMTTNLSVMQRNGWPVNRGNMQAGNIVVVNTNVQDPNQTAATVTVEQEAINSGRVSIPARFLSATDWQVIIALATGLPAFIRPANANQRTIASTFTSPPIQFLIYDDRPVVVPAAVAITAAQFLASLTRLATVLRAETCFVKGFIAASTYLCGVIAQHNLQPPAGAAVVPAPQLEQFFITSGMEVRSIQLPRVTGSNFLWDVLGLVEDRLGKADWLALEDEWRALTGCDLDEYLAIQGGVAALYTTGVSTTLHQWNLSGRCLSAYTTIVAGLPQAPVVPFLQYLFLARQKGEFMPLAKVACNMVGQFSAITIYSKSLQAANWCATGRDLNPPHEDTYWNAQWGRNIPYILNPLAIARFLVTVPATFGLSMPPMASDFQSAYVFTGPVDDVYFSAGLGDGEYNIRICSEAPFAHVPYGALAINFIHQHRRLPAAHVISFRQLVKASARRFDTVPEWLEGPQVQPDYHADLHHIAIGTMPTYDWFTQRVLVPHIRRINMAAHEWMAFKLVNTGPSNTAGVVFDITDSTQYNIHLRPNFEALFEIEGVSDTPIDPSSGAPIDGDSNTKN